MKITNILAITILVLMGFANAGVPIMDNYYPATDAGTIAKNQDENRLFFVNADDPGKGILMYDWYVNGDAVREEVLDEHIRVYASNYDAGTYRVKVEIYPINEKNNKLEQEWLLKIVDCECSNKKIPVCGEDGIEYDNKCFAGCADVDYTEGVCESEPDSEDVIAEIDQDKDGVEDKIDECLNTPKNVEVNANGCSCSQLKIDDGNQCTNDICSKGIVTYTNVNLTFQATCPLAGYANGVYFNYTSQEGFCHLGKKYEPKCSKYTQLDLSEVDMNNLELKAFQPFNDTWGMWYLEYFKLRRTEAGEMFQIFNEYSGWSLGPNIKGESLFDISGGKNITSILVTFDIFSGNNYDKIQLLDENRTVLIEKEIEQVFFSKENSTNGIYLINSSVPIRYINFKHDNEFESRFYFSNVRVYVDYYELIEIIEINENSKDHECNFSEKSKVALLCAGVMPIRSVDLRAYEIAINPWSEQKAGEIVWFEFYLQNKGEQSVNDFEYEVDFENGKKVTFGDLSLNAGEKATIMVSTVYDEPGNYEVKISLDPDEEIEELNEQNNRERIFVQIKEG